MKVGYNGFTVEFGNDDIKEATKVLASLWQKLISHFNVNKIQDFNVALIDGRYDITGYIISYGVVRTSAKKIKEILDNFKLPFRIPPVYLLEDIFDEKILIKNSGELNGYESDTPELSDMNFVIRIQF